MKYLSIQNTTLKVSALCLGTGGYGTAQDVDKSFSLMDRFCERGGNFLDTANIYGKWVPDGKNHSEITIGKWLKARGGRDKLVIGTKGAHPQLATMDVQRLSRDEILTDLEESLCSLQTDYIDLYWLHRDDPQRPVGDILETLNSQVKAGKIRYFGCSNWTAARIKEAEAWAAQEGVPGFVANQMMWSFAVPNTRELEPNHLTAMDRETFTLHQKSGMAAIPYSSQANGLFSKALREGFWELPESEMLKRNYYNNETLNRLERVRKLSKERGGSGNRVALAYLLNQPFTTIPIIGPGSLEHLEESLQALELRLDAETLAYLESGRK